jgi:lysophospholipase L1-like esterase
MKNKLTGVAAILAAGLLIVGARGAEAAGKPVADTTGLEWHAFPDTGKFAVRGLAWFAENSPQFLRMPVRVMESLPKGVQNRAKCPSGGRIVLRCTTSRLALRAAAVNGGNVARFEAYVDGRAFRSAAGGKKGTETELVLFEGLGGGEKEVVIYLPHLQEVLVSAIGVDPGTRFRAPAAKYARPLPVVFYGSSVCQGSGSASPAQTYEAILCRELNLDFINLGFGGAGKAETNVVELVNSIPGCCYVFDLGKSYGAQDATAFKAMLQAVRRSHPEVPLIVMTPITSVKEVKEPAYAERSVHTRTVMREPVKELIAAGDRRIILLEGEDLLGFKEHDALSKDGVHPAERGYEIIAGKLVPVMKKALGR